MKRGRARPSSSTLPGMNRTEARYRDHLERERLAGRILSWRFEPLRFRLGLDWKTSYLPDFMVQLPDGTYELHEVKGARNYRAYKGGPITRAGGHWPEDSRLKIKVAAHLYPDFGWVGVRERKPIDGPEAPAWIREPFHK